MAGDLPIPWSRYRSTPFDPPEPDALEAAEVGEPPVDPRTRIPGGFAALKVERRDRPGYPGSFMQSGSAFDPAELKTMGVPVDEGGYYPTEGRQPMLGDLLNPLAVQAGVRAVALAPERALAQQLDKEDRLRREAAGREATARPRIYISPGSK